MIHVWSWLWHLPLIKPFSCSSSSVSSRSSLAHLYSAGFPDIVDGSGQVAEVLDPTEPVPFDPQREETGLLQGNLVVFQFLAFTRWGLPYWVTSVSSVTVDWNQQPMYCIMYLLFHDSQYRLGLCAVIDFVCYMVLKYYCKQNNLSFPQMSELLSLQPMFWQNLTLHSASGHLTLYWNRYTLHAFWLKAKDNAPIDLRFVVLNCSQNFNALKVWSPCKDLMHIRHNIHPIILNEHHVQNHTQHVDIRSHIA